MAEREGLLLGNPNWDIEGATEVLKAIGQSHEHPILGAGHRLILQEAPGPLFPRLDLYSDRLVVRYRDSLARLELFNIGKVQPEEDHVWFASADQDEKSLALLYPNGSLKFTLASAPGRQPANPEPSSKAVAEETTTFTPPAAEENPAQPSSPENANRVVLTGRLGRNVNLQTRSTGKVIGRVPLAVHRGEETDWHTILFFDEKAKKAAEDLAKGQLVTVIGYKHLREVQGKDGPKQVEEIYAASVQGQK